MPLCAKIINTTLCVIKSVLVIVPIIVTDKYSDILEEEIDELGFMSFTESMIKDLIPKIGMRSKFYQNFVSFKKIQVSVIKKIKYILKYYLL